MHSLTKSMLYLLVAGATAMAGPFDQLMSVAHTTWPEKVRIGVICNYETSQSSVASLASAMGPNMHITVADLPIQTRSAFGEYYVPKAATALARNKVDILVLLPSDPIVRDGSWEATLAVKLMEGYRVPTIATSGKALRQGATFCIGEGTGGQLLVNPKVPKGAIGPVEVQRETMASLDLRPNWKEVVEVIPVR